MDTTSEPSGDPPEQPRDRRSGQPHGRRPGQASERGSTPRRYRRTPASLGADPKTAGFLIVAAIIALGGAGLGIGSAVGLPVPFALAGLFAGLAVGFLIVYSRFKDL